MKLSKYKINNLNVRKSRTDMTDFQQSISENNQDLFFAYIEHFKDNINLNQIVNKTFRLIHLAYGIGYYKKDFTIFNFLYNHPSIDRNIESQEGKTLLNFAANKKDIENFKRFENDGITGKDMIYSFFSNLPILADNVDFTLLEYMLKNPNYILEKEHMHWAMNGITDYYYRTEKQESIKKILFDLQEKGGLFCSNSQNHRLLLQKTINNNDFTLLQEILNNETFINNFKKTDFDSFQEHPFHHIIQSSLDNFRFFDIYKPHYLTLKTKEEDSDIFHSLFNNFNYNRSSINHNHVLLIFKALIKDFHLNPYQFSEGSSIYDENQCAVTEIFNISDTYTLNLLKIMDSQNSFNINQVINFKDNIKACILEYAYEKDIRDKKIVLSYIKNNPRFDLTQLENIEQSPLFLSLIYNDNVLFDKSFSSIDYNFKNENHENLIIHLLKNNYKQKYFNMITGNKFKDFSNLIQQISLNLSTHEIYKDHDNILKAMDEFKNNGLNAVKYLQGGDINIHKHNIDSLQSIITLLCEKANILSTINKDSISKISSNKKRI